MSSPHLCVHGHFYQPPRENPLTGTVEREAGAAPYHDFNEKIWDECYRPNAAAGNLERMSFDLGPTLAAWLQQAHPRTLAAFTAAAQANRRRSGHGNALAQAYHHTILPLATPREKRLQVAWGLRDFRRRFGYTAAGMWLPEAAVDEETLEALAACGVQFTILAPWQAAVQTTPHRPGCVTLPSGRHIDVCYYSALSGPVSFDDGMTADAGRFVASALAAEAATTRRDGGPPLILIATDGELYGHHKAFRDLFLQRLLHDEAPAHGYTVGGVAAYLARYPATEPTAVHNRTSWSCQHGVSRWDEGCACTAGDASWKRPLRRALRELATRIDAIYEAETRGLLRDPWAAIEAYLDLRDCAVAPALFWREHGARTLTTAQEERLGGLLEMAFARHAMFVSCAWFFEDLDRREPRIALAQAHRAITLARRCSGADLQPAFVQALTGSLSLRTGRSAASIYRAISG